MSWGDAMAAEQATDAVLKAHAVRIGHMENAAFEAAHLSFGSSYRQGYRKGFREAIAWVLHMQETNPKFPKEQ